MATVVERKISCDSGATLNYTTAQCSFNSQKGVENDPLFCKRPSLQVGNPINAANGNKFQYEEDFKLGVADSIVVGRYYNSIDGLWRHSFSDALNVGKDFVVLIHADGRESMFKAVDGKYVSTTDLGVLLLNEAGWTYTSTDGSVMDFSVEGDLVRKISKHGAAQNIARDKYNLQITNSVGQSVKISEDILRQLTLLEAEGVKLQYFYSAQRLSSITKNIGGDSSSRSYQYEDSRNPGLLTGITDERGVRFATWSYDDSGRAVSSQHSGGAGLTQIAYNADGSSSVTNELGKTTVYRYQQIDGVKRIIAIDGEPSPNCPASNSTYTYNDRGLVLTKTDAKGLVTNYDYNDRGFEISRTEASGTTLARTTTTEWDPDRFLPIKVIEPNRITVYSYDNQGRELTRQSTSR
ncbi:MULTISPECIES: DUF6531 domain-containing protein [Pseudomonas syringae group]|uniref:DUF6531 domain-containing protein n=2 Tax=Pseudomonas TaxID=286 RepID=UPI000F3E35F5|nr:MULTISPECIES: DUF6531 domain-containing protein [Pseudomonas syringae group]RMO16499.1 hypothetical protein ALQ45_200117 [Pseudomonas amygdali pv. morsprunorum]RMO99820.1 YD repeat-containing protein [Pseudomonas amygdali pv. morsprunorum]RMU24713.1 hypothetical protein ALP31_200149 [Pseudomonas amygdali pv. morsprunorum]